LLAVAASPFAATGLQRRLDPHRPFVVDVPVLVLGPLAAALVLVATSAVAAARADTSAANRQATPHPSPVVLPGPAGLFGGRVAAGWATSSGRTVARVHVVAVTIGLAATTAATVWSATADHVASTPSTYGRTWDTAISVPDEGTPDPTAVDTARSILAANPAVGSPTGQLTAGMVDFAIGVAGGRTEVLEVDRTVGPWWPSIIAGRAPETDDEITVGRAALERVGKAIGDSVEIADHRYTIVGTHVVPVFANGDFGSTIAIPRAGAAGLDLKLSRPWILVDLAPGVTVDRLQAAVGDHVVALSSPAGTDLPGPIANLARIGGIKGLLVAVCVLLALASFANGLLLGSFARRRDYMTMRALGAGRATVNGSVAWHAVVVAVLASSAGAVLGLLLGRAVWQSTATGLAIAPHLYHSWFVVAVVGVLSFAGAALVALATAWSAVRPPNAALRPE
jgi:hypothetical protein